MANRRRAVAVLRASNKLPRRRANELRVSLLIAEQPSASWTPAGDGMAADGVGRAAAFSVHLQEEAEKEEENQTGFDWEAVIDEAATEGESGSGEKFYDAEDENQGSTEVQEEIPAAAPQSSAQQKEKGISGVDPSSPTGRIPEAEFLKFQAEFERKRANRFHDDLEKAKAENARLLALLHQAQTKPHP
ncbi:hypothetical protein Dimus_003300 [Dionaea muscipula]